jgi:hypothetical protein
MGRRVQIAGKKVAIRWKGEGCKMLGRWLPYDGMLGRKLPYDGKKVAKHMGEGCNTLERSCKILGRRLQNNEKKVAKCWEEG